jgi:hypothetical protein
MGTVDAQHVVWISSGAALLGALIGSLGAVLSQYIAQHLMARREERERTRRETRTIEAFRGIIFGIKAVAITTKENPLNVGRNAVRLHATVVAPLRQALQEPTLYLSLKPDQVSAVFGVLSLAEAISVPYGNLDVEPGSVSDEWLAEARRHVVKTNEQLLVVCTVAEKEFDK